MIRIFSILGGLFIVAALAWSMLWGLLGFEIPNTVEHQFHKAPKHLALASDGVTGKFDHQQLQRGFQVYQEVCAACHSLRHVAYRDLKQLGYDDDEVKAIAAKAQIPDYNKATGELKTRPGLPTDKFPPVLFAALGVPPDLSLIAKARHHGPAYVYSLLTGYQAVPANLPKANHPGEGLHYNPYFANLNIAMAPPLAEGQVTYGEGNPKPTVDQMAKDVAAFLVWTAEPTLVKRRQTGWPVLGFLLFATILGYLAYRNIWAGMKH